MKTFFHRIKKTRLNNNDNHQAGLKKQMADNPYLQSRTLWQDVYGSSEKRSQQWYITTVILGITLSIAVIGMIMLATRSTIKPYPILLRGEEIIAVHDTIDASFNELKPKLAIHFAKEFLRNVRTLTLDKNENTRKHIAALSFTQGQATHVVKDYLDQTPQASKQSTTIAITSILRDSAKSFTIRWKETTYPSNVTLLSHKRRYVAHLNYDFRSQPSSDSMAKTNPLGFYITQLDWSEELA